MIEKSEVLRYLGYRGQQLSSELNTLVDECILTMTEAAEPKSTFQLFDIRATPAHKIHLAGTTVMLTGEDVFRHLHGADKCALLASTLGEKTDLILRQEQAENLTKAVILNACANDLIEKTCDKVHRQVEDEATRLGYTLGSRLSPGYGDFPLESQSRILSLLDAQYHIGLSVNESLLMIPEKSITAVIGLFPAAKG